MTELKSYKDVCSYLDSGNNELIIKKLNQSIETEKINPEDTYLSYIFLAEHYNRLKKYEESSDCLEKAIKAKPDCKINLINIIDTINYLIQNKKYKTALNYVNHGSEISTIHKTTNNLLKGFCLYYLEQYDEEISIFEKLIDNNFIDKKLKDEYENIVNATIGCSHFKQDHYETALCFLDKAIEKGLDKDVDVWTYKGDIHLSNNEYEMSIDSYKNAAGCVNANIPYLESQIKLAKDKLDKQKSKQIPSHITIQGNNNPINLGGILATDDAIINHSSVEPDNKDEINFCPKCGLKLNDDDLFCRKCGAKLK